MMMMTSINEQMLGTSTEPGKSTIDFELAVEEGLRRCSRVVGVSKLLEADPETCS